MGTDPIVRVVVLLLAYLLTIAGRLEGQGVTYADPDELQTSEEAILRDLNAEVFDVANSDTLPRSVGDSDGHPDAVKSAVLTARTLQVNNINICGKRSVKVRDASHVVTRKRMTRQTYKGLCRDHSSSELYACVQWRLSPRTIQKTVRIPVLEEQNVCCKGYFGETCDQVVSIEDNDDHVRRSPEQQQQQQQQQQSQASIDDNQAEFNSNHYVARQADSLSVSTTLVPTTMPQVTQSLPPTTEYQYLSQLERSSYHSLCSMWGFDHLRAFNGRWVNFTGGCEYTLVKHDTVDIAFENEDSCLKQRTSYGCQRKLFFRLKQRGDTTVEVVVFKAKHNPIPIAQTGGRNLPLPAKVSHSFFEHVGDYVIIFSNTWKILFNYKSGSIQLLFAKESVDGLCGDMASLPGHIADDQIGEYAAPWTRSSADASLFCTRPEYIHFKGSDPCQDPHLTDQQRLVAKTKCSDINGTAFAACHSQDQAVLSLNLFLEACERDMCAGILDGADVSSSLCYTVEEYARQCKLVSAAAAATLDWRREDFCAAKCSKDQQYRECGSSCPPSCSAVDANPMDCTDICIDGCACKDGYFSNGTLCYKQSDCSCSYMGEYYEPGAVIERKCNNCTCEGGRWSCTSKDCGGQCSITGDNRVITFDSSTYSNHFSECSYQVLDCEELKLTIEAQFSACHTDPDAFCMSQVKVLLGEQVEITLTGSSQIIKDGEHTHYVLPYSSPSASSLVSVVNASSHYRRITINSRHSPDVIVEWNGKERLYVSINSAWKSPTGSTHKCKGLCGNYDGDTQNDLNGLVPESFVDSQRTAESKSNGQCTPASTPGPCPDSVEKTKANCEHLLQSSKIFGKCWNVVPILGTRFGSFTQACEEDVCNCPDRGSSSSTPGLSCLCQSLATYAHLCALNGVRLSWRENFPQCKIQCPADQRYKECAQPCPTLCPMVLSSQEDLCNHTSCVEGCECETGYFRDQTALGRCVPLEECSCVYKDKAYAPGDVVVKHDGPSPTKCECKKGVWDCVPYVADDMNCPAGMTFETCTTPCQATCENRVPKCSSLDCVSRCACPPGQFQYNDTMGECRAPANCPCFFGGKSYDPGYVYPMGCNNCTCVNGSFECTEEHCPGFCAATGDPHYETFDGMRYSFQGQTKYVLAQSSDYFKVFVENVACGADGVTCTKAVEIHIPPFDGTGTIIKLKQELDITVNGKPVIAPYDICSIRILYNNLFVIVQDVKRDFKVSWDGSMRVYVEVDPCYGHRMQGLCGDFDGDASNDLRARSGIQEANVYAFGNSWKVDANALDTPLQYKSACDLKGSWRRLYSQSKCQRVLLADDFAACRDVVDVSYYLDRCVESTCACDLPGDGRCLCTSIAHYAHACGRHGICVKWREQFGCPMQCTGSSEYDPCSCPNRCPLTDSDCTRSDFYEGCTCPSGTVYDGMDCVPCPTCLSTTQTANVSVGRIEQSNGVLFECLAGHSAMTPLCAPVSQPVCGPGPDCSDIVCPLVSCPQCQTPVLLPPPAYVPEPSVEVCCKHKCLKKLCTPCNRTDPSGNTCKPSMVPSPDPCCPDTPGCLECPDRPICSCKYHSAVSQWNPLTCCKNYFCACDPLKCDAFKAEHLQNVMTSLPAGKSVNPLDCRPGQCLIEETVTARSCGDGCCTSSVKVYSCECRDGCTQACPDILCDRCYTKKLVRPHSSSLIGDDCCPLYECEYNPGPTCPLPSCSCSDQFPVPLSGFDANCCGTFDCACNASRCDHLMYDYKVMNPLADGHSYEANATWTGDGVCAHANRTDISTECGCCDIPIYSAQCCPATCPPRPNCSTTCPRQRLQLVRAATQRGRDCCDQYECVDVPATNCPTATCCDAADVVTLPDLYNTTTCCNEYRCDCNASKCSAIQEGLSKQIITDPNHECQVGYCLNSSRVSNVSPGCDHCCSATEYTCVPAASHPDCSIGDKNLPCPCQNEERVVQYTNSSCCPDYVCVCVGSAQCDQLKTEYITDRPDRIFTDNHNCSATSVGSELVSSGTEPVPSGSCRKECCSIESYRCTCNAELCPPQVEEQNQCLQNGGIWSIKRNASHVFPDCCPTYECACGSCADHQQQSAELMQECIKVGGIVVVGGSPSGVPPDCCIRSKCVCPCSTCPQQACSYCQEPAHETENGLCTNSSVLPNPQLATCCPEVAPCVSKCTGPEPSSCSGSKTVAMGTEAEGCCDYCECSADTCSNCPPEPSVISAVCQPITSTLGQCNSTEDEAECCTRYQVGSPDCPQLACTSNQVISDADFFTDKCCPNCTCDCLSCPAPPTCSECETAVLIENGYCSDTSASQDKCCPVFQCRTTCANASAQPLACPAHQSLERQEDCCYDCACNCSTCVIPKPQFPLCQEVVLTQLGFCSDSSSAGGCCDQYEQRDLSCPDACPLLPEIDWQTGHKFIPGRDYIPQNYSSGQCCDTCTCQCDQCSNEDACCASLVPEVNIKGVCSGNGGVSHCCDAVTCKCEEHEFRGCSDAKNDTDSCGCVSEQCDSTKAPRQELCCCGPLQVSSDATGQPCDCFNQTKCVTETRCPIDVSLWSLADISTDHCPAGFIARKTQRRSDHGDARCSATICEECAECVCAVCETQVPDDTCPSDCMGCVNKIRRTAAFGQALALNTTVQSPCCESYRECDSSQCTEPMCAQCEVAVKVKDATNDPNACSCCDEYVCQAYQCPSVAPMPNPPMPTTCETHYNMTVEVACPDEQQRECGCQCYGVQEDITDCDCPDAEWHSITSCPVGWCPRNVTLALTCKHEVLYNSTVNTSCPTCQSDEEVVIKGHCGYCRSPPPPPACNVIHIFNESSLTWSTVSCPVYLQSLQVVPGTISDGINNGFPYGCNPFEICPPPAPVSPPCANSSVNLVETRKDFAPYPSCCASVRVCVNGDCDTPCCKPEPKTCGNCTRPVLEGAMCQSQYVCERYCNTTKPYCASCNASSDVLVSSLERDGCDCPIDKCMCQSCTYKPICCPAGQTPVKIDVVDDPENCNCECGTMQCQDNCNATYQDRLAAAKVCKNQTNFSQLMQICSSSNESCPALGCSKDLCPPLTCPPSKVARLKRTASGTFSSSDCDCCDEYECVCDCEQCLPDPQLESNTCQQLITNWIGKCESDQAPGDVCCSRRVVRNQTCDDLACSNMNEVYIPADYSSDECCPTCNCNCSSCEPEPPLTYPACEFWEITPSRCTGQEDQLISRGDATRDCCGDYIRRDKEQCEPLGACDLPGQVIVLADRANGQCCDTCGCNCSSCPSSKICGGFDCAKTPSISRHGTCTGDASSGLCCAEETCSCLYFDFFGFEECQDTILRTDSCGCTVPECVLPGEVEECCCGSRRVTSHGIGLPCQCHDTYSDCEYNSTCPVPMADHVTQYELDLYCPLGFVGVKRPVMSSVISCPAVACEECGHCECPSSCVQEFRCPFNCTGCETITSRDPQSVGITLPLSLTPFDPGFACCASQKQCNRDLCPPPPTCHQCNELHTTEPSGNVDTCDCCPTYQCVPRVVNCPAVPIPAPLPDVSDCGNYTVDIVTSGAECISSNLTKLQRECAECSCLVQETVVGTCNCSSQNWTTVPLCPADRCSPNVTENTLCNGRMIYRSRPNADCAPDTCPVDQPLVCDSYGCCYCTPPPPPPSCGIKVIFNVETGDYDERSCLQELVAQGADMLTISRAQKWGTDPGCAVCPEHLAPTTPAPCADLASENITVEAVPASTLYPDCCRNLTYCQHGDCDDLICCNVQEPICDECEYVESYTDYRGCPAARCTKRTCPADNASCTQCPAGIVLLKTTTDSCGCPTTTCMCPPCPPTNTTCCPAGQQPIVPRNSRPDECTCICQDTKCQNSSCGPDHTRMLQDAKACSDQTDVLQMPPVCSLQDEACTLPRCQCPPPASCPSPLERVVKRIANHTYSPSCDCCDEYECVCPAQPSCAPPKEAQCSCNYEPHLVLEDCCYVTKCMPKSSHEDMPCDSTNTCEPEKRLWGKEQCCYTCPCPTCKDYCEWTPPSATIKRSAIAASSHTLLDHAVNRRAAASKWLEKPKAGEAGRSYVGA
ncbi:zonadhesin-like isoform X1 [Sycon ciliatum]|uniref:zonadhesin-like isoform X1 n=1 Tax=Sycon ciliatum TaxID=27933 RepID=UPI0031F61906